MLAPVATATALLLDPHACCLNAVEHHHHHCGGVERGFHAQSDCHNCCNALNLSGNGRKHAAAGIETAPLFVPESSVGEPSSSTSSQLSQNHQAQRAPPPLPSV